jgi:hypothetical protein
MADSKMKSTGFREQMLRESGTAKVSLARSRVVLLPSVASDA